MKQCNIMTLKIKVVLTCNQLSVDYTCIFELPHLTNIDHPPNKREETQYDHPDIHPPKMLVFLLALYNTYKINIHHFIRQKYH